MKIISQYIFGKDKVVLKALSRAGFLTDCFSEIGFDLYKLSCDRADERWPLLQKISTEHEMIEQTQTIFTEDEILSSHWCALWSSKESQYPQPEDDFRYIDETFAKRRFCADCGIGLIQKGPFFIKKAPSFSRFDLFRLFWEPFHIFVSRVVWEKCFEPFGVEAYEVKAIRDRKAIHNILQIRIEHFEHVDARRFPSIACEHCGRSKHEFYSCGVFPNVVRSCKHSAFRTSEIFGSGAIAGRYIIVNQEIANALMTNRVRGAILTPCKNGIA